MVFDYVNYRSYLDDTIAHLRVEGKYSNRSFAEAAGFKGHTYINLILQGKRNLSLVASRKVSAALGLSKNEREFFSRLVEFNQTKDLKRKNELYEELSRMIRSSKIQSRTWNEYELFENWYNVVVYEYLGDEWFEPNVEHIAKQLGITVTKVYQCLTHLMSLGLLDQQGDSFRKLDKSISTADDINSHLVKSFHVEMSQYAARKISQLPLEKREVNALTLALSKEKFERFKKRIREVTDEFATEFAEETAGETVYQFNIQLFPMLEKEKEH